MSCVNPECKKHIICRSIRKKGKVIYPKRASFFSFCITEDKEKATRTFKKQVA